MKYSFIIFLILIISCKKENKIDRLALSEKYNVKYRYGGNSAPIQDSLGAFIYPDKSFDTLVEIEVIVKEDFDDRIELIGLKEFKYNTVFERYLLFPKLMDNGNLMNVNYSVPNSTNGFLRNDSIFYYYKEEKKYSPSYSIIGVKVK